MMARSRLSEHDRFAASPNLAGASLLREAHQRAGETDVGWGGVRRRVRHPDSLHTPLMGRILSRGMSPRRSADVPGDGDLMDFILDEL
jgi:hypothetical protein